MSALDDINDAHALIGDYENLSSALSVVAWYFCGETFDTKEGRRHRDALVAISDAFERLKESSPLEPAEVADTGAGP